MVDLNPTMQDILILVIGMVLTLPGLAALYRGLHRDVEEQNIRLQVQSMAMEIQRLQVLTDDQAREIARLRVEVGSLRSAQKSLMEMARRLSQQVQQNGQVPIVDIDSLGDLLP